MQLIYEVPGMDAVAVERGIAFREGQTYDVYGDAKPIVVVALGYPDAMLAHMLGSAPRDAAIFTQWARLLAASGIAVALYEAREPVADIAAVVEHLRAHGRDRIGIVAWSGNGPTALAAACRLGLTCAVFGYTFLIGPSVAQAAARFRFANPGASVDDLPADLPLFVVRAGRDQPTLLASIDQFVAAALARNLPITVINHPTGPHSFDLVDATEASRAVVRRIVAYLREQLL